MATASVNVPPTSTATIHDPSSDTFRPSLRKTSPFRNAVGGRGARPRSPGTNDTTELCANHPSNDGWRPIRISPGSFGVTSNASVEERPDGATRTRTHRPYGFRRRDGHVADV